MIDVMKVMLACTMLALACGCATNRATARVDPNANLERIGTGFRAVLESAITRSNVFRSAVAGKGATTS